MIYYRFGWLPEMVLQSCGLAVISERSGDPDRQVGMVWWSCGLAVLRSCGHVGAQRRSRPAGRDSLAVWWSGGSIIYPAPPG